MTPPTREPEAMSVLDAADTLGVGQSRVYQLLDEGRLQRHGDGISTASINAYKADRRPPGRPRRTK